MSDFLNNIVSNLNDEDTNMASSGAQSAEFSGWIDTGSYILNAQFSGSIFGGMPDNKVVTFAGEEATGKSFFALTALKKHLDKSPDAVAFYFDTEAAVTKTMLEERGIDSSRVAVSEPVTVQQFRHNVLNILAAMADSKGDKPPMLFILDSLGQLSTTKEIEDTADGKETKDMSRSQLIKATFRVLNLKLAKAGVPMIVTNHVYDAVGCMTEGHMIQTINGHIPIEDIKEGDLVKTLTGHDKVLETYQYSDVDVIEFELDDGQKVTVTPGHKFMTKAGVWKTADELEVEDVIVSL